MKVFFFGCVGAAAAGFFAAVLWPWMGPLLLTPCPLPTTAGVWVWVALGTLRGLLAGVGEIK